MKSVEIYCVMCFLQMKSAPISNETKEKGDSGLVLLPEDAAKIPLLNTEPGVQSTLNLDQVSIE